MNNQGIEFNEMKSQQKPTPQKAERCKKKKPWPPPLPHLFFLLCPIHHCLFASLSLINKNIHLLNYILFLLDSSPNAFHLALVNLLSGCCCCHGRRRWSRRPAPAHRRWRASKHATASPPVTAARIGRHALVMVRTGKKRGAPHASCDRARRPGPGPVPPGWFVS